MSKNIVVVVDPRSDRGKNACRRLRAAGQVPGIVYGLEAAPFPIAVSPRRVEEILRMQSGRNTIFNLGMGDDKAKQRAVMIREIQRDPITDALVHLDFVRIDMEKRLTVNVPVHLVGTPDGVKNEGGVVDFVHRHVEVECLPVDIPERFEIDISALHIHQHVSVGDLTVSEKATVLDNPEMIIAVVIPPRAEEEVAAEPTEEEAAAAAEAEGAAGEPEVIKKGKEAEPAEESESKGE